jgi:hypothetical protein
VRLPWLLASWLPALALALLMPRGADGQDSKSTTRDIAVLSGRVERLDTFARSVTLRTRDGLQHTVYAGRELKTFDELRSGDAVTIRVTESVVVAVRPNAKMTAIQDNTAAAKQGPAASDADVLQQLKAVVKIDKVDMATQVITYKTADNRNVMRQVTDRHLIEGLKAGDVVEITYTRERAMEMTKTR